MPITLLQLAEYRLGRKARTGQDFEDAGLPMVGGCEICHATVSAYNACPSKSGNIRCLNGCIGEMGWDTVEQADRDIFPDDQEIRQRLPRLLRKAAMEF